MKTIRVLSYKRLFWCTFAGALIGFLVFVAPMHPWSVARGGEPGVMDMFLGIFTIFAIGFGTWPLRLAFVGQNHTIPFWLGVGFFNCVLLGLLLGFLLGRRKVQVLDE